MLHRIGSQAFKHSKLINRFVSQPKNIRWNSGKQLKNKKDEMTKEEVMKIAAQAKKEQKLYDMLLPEKSIGFTSPIFWVLVGVVGYLHYYNGEQAKIKEEDAIRERKLAQMAIERRKVAPLTNEERLAQIGLKERQVVIWENKLAQAQREVDARATGAEVRLAHAVDRLGFIKTSLAELRAGGENT